MAGPPPPPPPPGGYTSLPSKPQSRAASAVAGPASAASASYSNQDPIRTMQRAPVPLSLPSRPVQPSGGGVPLTSTSSATANAPMSANVGARQQPPYTPTSLYTPMSAAATPPPPSATHNSTASPRAIGGAPYPAGVTAPGSPFGASPKFYSTGAASSSASGTPSVPPVASTSAIPDNSAPAASPWSAIPPRLQPDQVAPTVQLIELGEGWTIRYRAWKAPAILVSGAPGGGKTTAGREGDGADGMTDGGRMDYDPWKAPLGSASSFAVAAGPGTALTGAQKGRTPASRTGAPNDGSGPPPSKKPKTDPSSSSTSAAVTATASKGGNAFDDLLAQEMASSTSSTGSTSIAALTQGADSITPSILMDAIKTPPLPGSSADKAKKPLRVPAALRKAKAREEQEAAAAAAVTAKAKDSPAGSSATPTATATAPPAPQNELGDSAATALQSSTASSSSSASLPESASSSSLRTRLEPICEPHFRTRDPLEVALRALRARKAQYSDRLDLLWHVQRQAVALGGSGSGEGEPRSSLKDKGKAKETDEDPTGAGTGNASSLLAKGDGHARVLWTFSVVKGGEKDPDDDLDMGSLDQILVDLEFEGLEALAEGEITHSSLFPALYPPGANSSSRFTPPLSSSARSFPSSLTLSEKILTVPSATDPTPATTPIQGAYTNFRAALTSCILEELVARPVEGRIPLRLEKAAVFLPDPEKVYEGMALPPTFRAEVHPPTLNRTALLLFTSISDVGLVPFSPALSSKKDSSQEEQNIRRRVILAPLEIEATVVKTFAAEAFSPERWAELREEWSHAFVDAGVSFERFDAEGFVLCSVASDASPSTSGTSAGLEVLWPCALILVDKARSSQHLEPIAAEATTVSSVDATQDWSTSPATSVATADAGAALSGPRSSADVWSWYKEETKRREEEKLEGLRREQEEQEATRQKEQARGASAEKGKSASAPSAAAPINERTPMSLGTASTEAPSPAELLALPPPHTNAASHEHDLARSVDSHATNDHHHPNGMDIDFGLNFYPSPLEAGQAVLADASGQSAAPLSTLDAALSNFDWGDGTFGAGTSSAAGHGSIPAHANGQRYEDSLMLGLTDDDFSFFDGPTGPVMNGIHAPLGHESAASLMSVSGPPGFDAFPPPVSASLPDNPFAFDMDGGFHMHDMAAASLAPSSQALAPLDIAPLSAPPPLAVCPAPVEGSTIASAGPTNAQGSHSTAALASPEEPTPIPIDFEPRIEVDGMQSDPVQRAVAAYSPVRFGDPTTLVDERFDPRRGKYGLPSPDSDNGGLALELVPVHRKEKRRTRSWYEAVYDPRLRVADRLVLQRTADKFASIAAGMNRSGSKASLQAPRSSRTWQRRRMPDGGVGRGSIDSEAFPSPDAWPQTAYNSDTAGADEDSEISEGTTSDEEVDAAPSDDTTPPTASTDALARETPGAALLACGLSFAQALTSAASTSAETHFQARSAMYEIAYAVFAEQTVYQRQLRRSLLAASKPANELTTAASTSTVTTMLSSVCNTLGASPLFSDQTALPSLVAEAAPAFSLRAQHCLVQTDSLAFDFWRAMGFEPIAAAKDVTAVVLCEEEESGSFVRAAQGWMNAMGSAYEGLRLGTHRPAEVAGASHTAAIRNGVLALPAGRLAGHALEAELKPIYAAIIDLLKHNAHVVVYVHACIGASLEGLGPLAEIIQQISKCRINANAASANVVAVPISMTLFQHPTEVPSVDLAAIAFSVYDQLQVAIERLRLPAPETFPSARPPPVAPLGPAVRIFQAPAVSIALPTTQEPQFSLSWPPSSFDIEFRHRFLHVCYAVRPVPGSPGQEWLVISIVDEKGETWRILPRYLKYPPNIVVDVHRARIIWNFTKGVIESADVEWRVLVCKLGEPTAVEIKAWESVLNEFASQSKRPLHLSFACVDPSPPMALARSDAGTQRPSTTSSIPEEGEFLHHRRASPAHMHVKSDSKVAVFDAESAFFSFTPAEPVPLTSLAILAPASTFLVHVPRTTSLAHCTPSPTFEDLFSRQAISAYGIHLLCSTASKSSLYDSPIASYLADVRRNFVELAALGKARWGTTGRMSWHLEAARDAILLSV
ncbi:hypothetical protein JCM10908_006902 [Rhodotorula pacifica]|uniref:uncharacterized protein n=1 Tax=Rhodotorula pacifica TaxID=1495444 RepID=UPI00317DBEEF